MTYQVRKNQGEDLAGGRTRIFGNCQFTGEAYECIVPTSGVLLCQSGAPAQVAFPDLNLDDREFMISGISPAGCEKTFGK